MIMESPPLEALEADNRARFNVTPYSVDSATSRFVVEQNRRVMEFDPPRHDQGTRARYAAFLLPIALEVRKKIRMKVAPGLDSIPALFLIRAPTSFILAICIFVADTRYHEIFY